MSDWNRRTANLDPFRDQEEILSRLEQQITQQTAGRIRNLKVEACGDGILLSGRTNTYYAKQLATQIAMDAQNPLMLQNAIEVV